MVPEGAIDCSNVLQQNAVGNLAKKWVNKGLARLQKRLKTLCQDRVPEQKTIPELLEGGGHNMCVNKHH